ncbi:hypothetical protein DMR_01490 [Solidesulfovibrio magneticus RS-1]|uniref:Uncharacterized protein n=1 Tax=Solidesulfovibrio magneticus (strain ATCC 700980 / DSM 13731 / RS-1) TaxID=573370 RepID=C4XTX5_SOLM1|nr:hypothetical protein DMR_01490 [Solidesulfovibrio magneticus RS-1]
MNTITQADDVGRFKTIAFWHWEYTRRNRLYKLYSNKIESFRNGLIGAGGLHQDITVVPLGGIFDKYLYKQEGEQSINHLLKWFLIRGLDREKGMLFLRYRLLFHGFNKKFKRYFKPCHIGIDSSEQLDKLLSGNLPCFEIKDLVDLIAILPQELKLKLTLDYSKARIKILGPWFAEMVSVENTGQNNIKIEMDQVFKFSDDVILDREDQRTISGMANVLAFLNRLFVNGCKQENPLVTDYMLQLIYRFCLAGKHIKSSSIMRLAMLWLWDQAHKQNEDNPAQFDDVYPLLKSKIEQAGVSGKVWEQIVTRRKRVRGYYDVTDYCIKNRTIISLNQ